MSKSWAKLCTVLPSTREKNASFVSHQKDYSPGMVSLNVAAADHEPIFYRRYHPD